MNTTKEIFVTSFCDLQNVERPTVFIDNHGLYNLYKNISKNDCPKIGLFAVFIIENCFKGGHKMAPLHTFFFFLSETEVKFKRTMSLVSTCLT